MPEIINSVGNYFKGVGQGLGDVLVEHTLPGKILLDPIVETRKEKRQAMADQLAREDHAMQLKRFEDEQADLPIKQEAAKIQLGRDKLAFQNEQIDAKLYPQKAALTAEEKKIQLAKARRDFINATKGRHIAEVDESTAQEVDRVDRQLYGQSPEYVPLTKEQQLDIYGPTNKKVGSLKELLVAGKMFFSGDPNDREALNDFMRQANIEISKDGTSIRDLDNPDVVIPLDQNGYRELIAKHLEDAVRETTGRIHRIRQSSDSLGLMVNDIVDMLRGEGTIDENDVGDVTNYFRNRIAGGDVIKEMTPEQAQKAIARTQKAGILASAGAYARSTDPSIRRRIFGKLLAALGKDQGAKVFGGIIEPVNMPADPGMADPKSWLVKFIPNDAKPEDTPFTGNVQQLVDYLSQSDPVAQDIASGIDALRMAKSVKNQEAIDKEVNIRERYAERMLLKEAGKKPSVSEMEKEALQMAEAQIPPGTAARPEAVKNRAGQIFNEMRTGKRVEQPKRVTAEDFLINAIGE